MPSQIVIATTTPNRHINSIARKYDIKIIKGTHTNIGGDFDFAIQCGHTPLVTIAHQDDSYEKTYTEQIINAYRKYPDSTIIFTDHYEIRQDQKVITNTNLKAKRILLAPIFIKNSLKSKFAKRQLIRFGCSICCPAVTFVKTNCPAKIFSSSFKCDVDWHAWEKLSKKRGAFTFIPQKLMGHRISQETTTTSIINQGIRKEEDYELFCRFWPKPISGLLVKIYQKSEKSNSLK